jgi:predicted glycogen debranching enzyme
MALQTPYVPAPEWLETDGLGGFSMGSRDLLPYRRYHALLNVALTPPTNRIALLNMLEMCVVQGENRYPLHRFRFHPGITEPSTAAQITSFSPFPFPTWTFSLPNTQTIIFELFRIRDEPNLLCSWTLSEEGDEPIHLEVRPLLSGRSIHALHNENNLFNFAPELINHGVVWQPYEDMPTIAITTNGDYTHQPDWYRNFRYDEDEVRGYHGSEDLAAPGVFTFEISKKPALLIAAASASRSGVISSPEDFSSLRSAELARRLTNDDPEHLNHNAQHFIVRRGKGSSIIAGYPWFSDWGRDTLIAMRGLTLSLGQYDEAASILQAWSREISEGMLPNTFSDQGAPPQYNSVDAALWFVIACHDLWSASEQHCGKKDPLLLAAIDEILTNYLSGTRFGIRADSDGLLACGTPGVQLTWMDAKVGEVVFTPRIGKPVEIQALWINALTIAATFNSRWQLLATQAFTSFTDKFWNDEEGILFDVVDCDHRVGTKDGSMRPNQLFAVGGLPHMVVSGDRARAIIDAVESQLYTPGGMRSLAPSDPQYRGRYYGAQWNRDAAYHQGTAWGWLIGPFVEGWVRVRGGSIEAKQEALRRFVQPASELFKKAGFGACPEIADGNWPHTLRGAPFQAWTLGEYIRLTKKVLV